MNTLKEQIEYLPKDNLHEIAELLLGYTKVDFEIIFYEIIAPIYVLQSTNPSSKPYYKLIKRNTNKEYTYKEARSKVDIILMELKEQVQQK